MVDESAQEEWVRVLTERPADRDEEESRYVQAVGESGFMLVELVAAEDADLSPDDRLRELGPLAPYLEEKLASTRREGIWQDYLADGRGTE